MNADAGRAGRIGKSTRQPGTLTCLPDLALAIVALYTLSELAADVRAGERLVLDRLVMETLHHLASPWMTAAMRLVTASGSAPMLVALSLGLGVYLWRQAEGRTEAVILLVTLAGSAVLGQGLKFLFARPRPQLFPWLTTVEGWSFPSGHTLTAVVLGGLLAWLMGRRLSGWGRAALWTVVGLWVGLVGLSRVYLGVHYPSDVLASLAVGSLCVLAALYVRQTTVPQSEE